MLAEGQFLGDLAVGESLGDQSNDLFFADGAGFTFQRGDVADLTRILALLIQADTLRADAGRAARRRSEENYLWPKITKEIEAAYLGCWAGSAMR